MSRLLETKKCEMHYQHMNVINVKRSFFPFVIYMLTKKKQFYEAIGDEYDRHNMVQFCSRHRSRDTGPDTPEEFWKMSFPSEETQDI